MKIPWPLSLALVAMSACGEGGSHEPGVPILNASGTISLDGRNVVPSYAVAGSTKSGKSVGVILSDARTGCSALTADYSGSNMPEAGTYVAVGVPGSGFVPGGAENSVVYFTVVSASGDVSGSGSNAGRVDVLDATDTAVTIRVDYRDSLGIGECVVSGEFTATRCPSD
jgi:hypothetical protein